MARACSISCAVRPVAVSVSSQSAARGGGGELLVAVGVFGGRSASSTAPSVSRISLFSSLEEGLVAADAGSAGRGRRAAVPPTMPWGVCGFLKRTRPASGSGLTAMILRAVCLGLLQGGEHPGVVGARVLADDDDQVGLVEILEGDAALADADGLGERGAGGLVAHVGAVGQVVGAEARGRRAGRGRRPRCWCGRRCRRAPRRGSRARCSSSAMMSKALLPADRFVVVGALGEVAWAG